MLVRMETAACYVTNISFVFTIFMSLFCQIEEIIFGKINVMKQIIWSLHLTQMLYLKTFVFIIVNY